MSHSIFKGTLGSEEKKGARYKPGSGEYDSGLVGDMLALYASGVLDKNKRHPRWEGKNGFRDLVHILDRLITSRADVEGLDPKSFLEDLASSIHQGIELTGRADVFSLLVDPVMQVLYRHGHDELELDLSLLPPAHLEVGGKLEGSEDRVLRVKYTGTFEDVGFLVRHVRLELHGTATWAGPNAQHSEFVLHGPAELIGLNASNCTYHLLFEHDENTTLYGKNNRFYFHKGLDEGVQTRIWLKSNARKWLGEPDILVGDWEQFFSKGNKIFIPKGEDEWDELVPYGS